MSKQFTQMALFLGAIASVTMLLACSIVSVVNIDDAALVAYKDAFIYHNRVTGEVSYCVAKNKRMLAANEYKGEMMVRANKIKLCVVG